MEPAARKLKPATGQARLPLFLRAAWGQDTPRAPIWVMRQAGRYLPEYREIKSKASFWEMCRTPELAAEITLQPIRRFGLPEQTGLDAAIIFNDIMTPLPPMGVEIEFSPGPVIQKPLRSLKEIEALTVPSQAEIAPFLEAAIKLARHELEPTGTPLIGFGGAPLTLATYLVQGSGSKDFEHFRVFLRTEPKAAHLLLEKLTELSIRYLKAQIEAGAQAVQLFDSWAGLHDQRTYREFALPYNRRVFEALSGLETTSPNGLSEAPRIYLAVGSSHLYPVIQELPCEVFSLDWRMELGQIRSFFPGRTLQGNLDPTVLLASLPVITEEAERVLQGGLGGPHIFNLGHGILRETPPEHLAHLIRVVRAFDRQQANQR